MTHREIGVVDKRALERWVHPWVVFEEQWVEDLDAVGSVIEDANGGKAAGDVVGRLVWDESPDLGRSRDGHVNERVVGLSEESMRGGGGCRNVSRVTERKIARTHISTAAVEVREGDRVAGLER